MGCVRMPERGGGCAQVAGDRPGRFAPSEYLALLQVALHARIPRCEIFCSLSAAVRGGAPAAMLHACGFVQRHNGLGSLSAPRLPFADSAAVIQLRASICSGSGQVASLCRSLLLAPILRHTYSPKVYTLVAGVGARSLRERRAPGGAAAHRHARQREPPHRIHAGIRTVADPAATSVGDPTSTSPAGGGAALHRLDP